MIVINLRDVIGLCVLAAFILFWIGVILYVNISAWVARKRVKKERKKRLTVEPSAIKPYIYRCTACPKNCYMLTISEGLVTTSCQEAENEHILTNWERVEE